VRHKAQNEEGTERTKTNKLFPFVRPLVHFAEHEQHQYQWHASVRGQKGIEIKNNASACMNYVTQDSNETHPNAFQFITSQPALLLLSSFARSSCGAISECECMHMSHADSRSR
jgi:hypothetical protein